MLEGHVLNLHNGFNRFPGNTQLKEIRITGGIGKSVCWRQTLVDIFNCPAVSVSGEAAVTGAAMHAMWCYFFSIN